LAAEGLPFWEAYFKEKTASPTEREAISATISALVNQVVPRQFATDAPVGLLETLRTNGIIRLPELQFSASQVRLITAYLAEKRVYAAHVPVYSDGIARSLSDPKTHNFPFGSYTMADVIQSPHLLELAFHPTVLALAERYLGCAPTLFSMHAWWSFPGFASTGPQTFHRDYDDYRFLALFVYLTDVHGSEQGGQHDFIYCTHRQEALARLFYNDLDCAAAFFPPKSTATVHPSEQMYRKIFGDNIQSITGVAGSVFLADTYGLHRGVRPTQNGRLVCWMRYGLRRNQGYVQDQSRPVDFDWSSHRLARNPYNQYVSRLLLT
jgi:hypothetical protein